jgi:hypothetical protein
VADFYGLREGMSGIRELGFGVGDNGIFLFGGM